MNIDLYNPQFIEALEDHLVSRIKDIRFNQTGLKGFEFSGEVYSDEKIERGENPSFDISGLTLCNIPKLSVSCDDIYGCTLKTGTSYSGRVELSSFEMLTVYDGYVKNIKAKCLRASSSFVCVGSNHDSAMKFINSPSSWLNESCNSKFLIDFTTFQLIDRYKKLIPLYDPDVVKAIIDPSISSEESDELIRIYIHKLLVSMYNELDEFVKNNYCLNDNIDFSLEYPKFREGVIDGIKCTNKNQYHDPFLKFRDNFVNFSF